MRRVVPQFHFFGFEGRSALPSLFDCSYCYALGFNAGVLLENGQTGMISTIANLAAPVEDWRAVAWTVWRQRSCLQAWIREPSSCFSSRFAGS